MKARKGTILPDASGTVISDDACSVKTATTGLKEKIF